MITEINTKSGIKLPLSDWLLVFFYIWIIPFFIGLIFVIIAIIIIDYQLYLLIECLFLLGLLPFFLIKFSSIFKELKKTAEYVGYVHFKPSIKDILLYLFPQMFLIIIMGLLFYLIFENFSMTTVSLWIYLVIAGITSLGFQGFIVFIAESQKQKLLSTAQEKISENLESKMHTYPNSNTISEYRFADIKPASLFLSAGVTTYTWRSNICIISRYFQWKLTEDELLIVLSHEIGHVNNKDMFYNYFMVGTSGWLRILRFFAALSLFTQLPGEVSSNLSLLLLYIFELFLILFDSICLNLVLQYRLYLQEIRADAFGAKFVSNTAMAKILKKLSSVIPAPVNDDPLEFLGFRIAILRERARDNSEEPEDELMFGRGLYKV